MASRNKATRADRRAPMGARTDDVPRADLGRTGTGTTPVYIRGAVDADGTLDRAFIRARLGEKLGKYARRIDRLDVAVAAQGAVRGPKGLRITIEASVASGGPLAVSGTGATALTAFQAAVRAAERSIRRWVERRRSTSARAQANRP